MQPSISKVNVTMARLLALFVGIKLSVDNKRTVMRANKGERRNREQKRVTSVLGWTDDDGDVRSIPSRVLVEFLLFTREPARTKIAAGKYAEPKVFIAPNTGESGALSPKNKFRKLLLDPTRIPKIEPMTGGLKNDLMVPIILCSDPFPWPLSSPKTEFPKLQNKGLQHSK